MSKITINNEDYIVLGNVVTAKRRYAYGKSTDICLFENVNNEWDFAKKDLSLAGNANTSLTALNERALLFHELDNFKGLTDDDITEKIIELQDYIVTPEAKEQLKGNSNFFNDFDSSTRAMLDFFDSKLGKNIKANDDFDIIDVNESDLGNSVLINFDTLKEQMAQYDNQKNVPVNDDLMESFEPTSDQMSNNTSQENIGLTPDELNSIDNVFKKDDSIEEKTFEVKPEEPKVEENKSIPEPMEVSSIEEIKPIETKSLIPSKVKTLLPAKVKDAAYVDTVILCLVAQLAIFGLLIFVLLLIK